MVKRKVMIVGGGGAYAMMFRERGWEITASIADADLVQFTGGEDVTPELYGQKAHPTTGSNRTRDNRETETYNIAQELGVACAGICRGGQFLNVMNGGLLYQDVDNHGREHLAYMYGHLLPIKVSSTHHQQMRANYGREVHILMTANECTRKESMDVAGKVVRQDVKPYTTSIHASGSVAHLLDIEALYYADTNNLCFQPHPEFGGYQDCTDAYFHLIHNYLFEEKSKFKEEVAA